MTEGTAPGRAGPEPSPGVDRPRGDSASPLDADRSLAAIRDFAAERAAELADFGALLAQLRGAVEPAEPEMTIDADAVWQRVLARLDRASEPGDTGH